MSFLLYALTFLPLVLLTMALHEAGHLVAAKRLGVPVQSFQVGLGWTLARWHTGRRRFRLASHSRQIGSAAARPGADITIFYRPVPETSPELPEVHTYCAYRRKDRLNAADTALLKQFRASCASLNGKIKDFNNDELVIAPMEWRLRAIPLAAFVGLQDDPSGELPKAWHRSSLTTRLLLIFAGPAANLLLAIAALGLLDVLPSPTASRPILTVHQVQAGSQAHHNGLQPGQRIIQLDTARLFPTQEDLDQTLAKNAAQGDHTHLTVDDPFVPGTVTLTVPPGHWLAGATLAIGPPPRYYRLPAPPPPPDGIPIDEPSQLEQQSRNIGGPLLGAWLTAQAVEYAFWHGWLAILAAVNITVGLGNLIPIPPLDGWQIVLSITAKLRGGRQLAPATQARIAFAGILVIAIISLLLFFKDLEQIIS